MQRWWIVILVLQLFWSCGGSAVDGIEIGSVLSSHLSYSQLAKLSEGIRLALDDNYSGLETVIETSSDGEASYDLGSVVVEILVRIGDDRFARMVSSVDVENRNSLDGLLMAGWEYGGFSSVPGNRPATWQQIFPMTAAAIAAK